MRNLKRALSLALASVMVLGLMVVGTGASYKDVTSEQNQEAIEVLQAVGIMKGDDNGNFNPDAPVSRNEMAVVMANLMDYRVATYAGTSPFTDVPAWAEPYVAACWTNGITSGYTATTYGGSDSVTTAQAALMLMKALGYFQYASDFGDDWMLATTRQANKIDLFDDVDSGVREAMTRNDLAQLVLNTLKSGVVDATDDTIKVETGDVLVQGGSVKYDYVTSGKDYATAISDLDTYTSSAGTGGSYGAIVELGEKLYQGDLKMKEDEHDAFGRPATQWKLNTEEIGTYANKDELQGSWTGKVTRDSLYSLIGRDIVKKLNDGTATATTLSVYSNGKTVTTPNKDDYFSLNSSEAIGSGNDVGKKGVLTEAYMNDDGDVTIVFITTYVAQANGDYRESSESLNTITLTSPTGYTVGTLELNDFENLAEFKDEDYILYTVSYTGTSYQVETVEKATLVTGEVTSYNEGDDVSIDDTKYDYAQFACADDKNGKAVTYSVGNNATIVLDAYGYCIYVDDASVDSGNYVYVDGIIKKSGFGSDYQARIYNAVGIVEEVTINKMYNKNSSKDEDKIDLNGQGFETTIGSNGHKLDGWYSYSTNSAGEYTLKRAANTSTSSSTRIEYASGNVTYSETVKFLEGQTVRGNSSTIFIVDDGDDIEVYTGINNAPEVTFPASPSGKVYVSYMLSKDKTENNASLVWIYTDNTNATVDGASNDNVLYVLKQESVGVKSSDGTRIQKWSAILNGEKTTIWAEAGDLDPYTMYQKYTIDSDGYYDGTAFQVKNDQVIGTLTKGASATTGDIVVYDDGTISLGIYAYSVTDDTQIVLILNDNDTSSSDSGSKNNANAMGGRDSAGNIILMADDPAAKHLVYTGLTGKTLENYLKGYSVDGTFYGVLKDSDKDELEILYVVITDARAHD